MITSLPTISIVTPSFNQGKFLERTILSVLEQNYPNLEYIIIDGGSTDNSLEIIKKYKARLKFWVSEPDRGQSHAINKGFAHATGEIYGWLNSDDRYYPHALEAIADAFLANPAADVVVGAGDMVDEERGWKKTIAPFPVSVKSLYGAVDRYFAQPSCFFSRRAWNDCGPLDENLHLAMDLDLWLKFAEKYRYATTDANLSMNLIHKDAKTTSLAAQSLVDACLVIMRHGGGREGRDRLVAFLQDLQHSSEALVAAHARIAELSAEVQMLKEFHSQCEDVFLENLRTIDELRKSRSWKMTAPLRWALDKVSLSKAIPRGNDINGNDDKPKN